MTDPEAKSSPAGLTENVSEQLDLLVACAKPASGQNSARVAVGLVRDYIADLIRERDEARAAQSSPPGGEIQGLVERAMALANAATPGEWAAVHNGYYWELQTRSPDWPRMGVGDTCESSVIFAKDGSKADHGDANAAFIAASRQLIPELCEAITRLSQPSGEEIREACARVAYDYAEKMERSVLERTAFGRPHIVADSKADAARDIANTIRSLPLSSGSNKSDEGKKGQAG